MVILLARIISSITNPLLVLFLVPYMLLSATHVESQIAIKWTVFTFLFVIMIGLFVFFEVKRGVFTDFDVSKKEQRPLLFMVVAVISVIYFLSLIIFHGPPVLFATLFGLIIGIFCISLLNYIVKASIHVAISTAVLLSAFLLYHLPYYVLLIIPVIAWSRVVLKRHTLTETITGFGLGTFMVVLMYLLLKFGFHFTINI